MPPTRLHRSCIGLVPVLLAGCFLDPPTVEPSGSESSGPAEDGSTGASAGATSTSGSASGSSSGPAVDDTAEGETTEPPATSTGPDDASTGGSEGSSTGEPTTTRLVFVTEGAFFANLGGVTGADARCEAEAEAAGHPGEFLAWISDSSTSPADRFLHEGGAWVLADGSEVAEDWDDLVDGTLAHPIDLDAEGQPLDDQLAVWTNTGWNGLALAADCEGWTSMAFQDAGIFGDFTQSAEFGQWTAWGDPTPFPCENTFHLYCFEQ